jgi:LysR family hydrogen peroxide-inducible transcriptional activator
MNAIPKLTIRELGYLVALADHGHFGRAAEACCIGQPTLSTQLSKLEKKLGVTLFERTSKSVEITPAGQKILSKARQIIAEAERIIELGHRHEDPLSGKFRLGIIPTLSVYLLSWLVPVLKKAAPKLKLIPHEDLTTHLVDALHHHEIDAALLALPVHEHDLDSIALFDEPFWAVLPRDSPVAKRSRLSSKDLAREHLLLLTEGHCLRDQALDLCGRANVVAETDTVDFRATSLETICEMVANGMGCTLMPAMAVAHHEKRGASVVSRPLGGKAFRRIGLVYRTSYPLLEDLVLFGEIIARNLPNDVNRLT